MSDLENMSVRELIDLYGQEEKSSGPSPNYQFRIKQNGVVVAEGSGPRDQLLSEALVYAAQYGREGAFSLEFSPKE